MKRVVIAVIATILVSCGQIETQKDLQENDLSESIVIKDFNAVKQGYGQNVVAEVENRSNKKATFVSVEFTWYDKNGKLINSQQGNARNINSNSTGIVDSYFDEMPKGATYKAKIADVTFE